MNTVVLLNGSLDTVFSRERGLFDTELYIEHGERRYGPYTPIGGPVPLHRYRRFQKTRTEQRAERVEALAARLELPRTALDGGTVTFPERADRPVPQAQSFHDPDPFQELHYPNAIAAKKAIARMLGMPLARLPADRIAALDALLSETLDKPVIDDFVRTHLKRPRGD